MDSVAEDDPTLPLDLEKSANIARFKEAIASGEFGEEMLNISGEFPEGNFQKLAGTSENAKESAASQMKTLKDYEMQMSELKKENFGLKLRIYFLEERLQHDDTPEDIFKMNIELKVTVEELKKELVEKQELLIKASNAVEMIANHSDSQIKQIKEDHEEYLSEVKGNYETKVKEMEVELASTKRDLEDVAERLTEAVNMNQQLNEKLLESTAGFNENQQHLQEKTKESLNVKDKMIDDLNAALESQRAANKELEEKAQTCEEEKEKAQNDLRKLVEGEKKLKALAGEVNKREKSFEDLKEKARKLEKLNRELKNQLHEFERQQHLSSRNSIDNSPEIQLKNKTRIEDLEKSLAAARESAHTAKMKWYQTFEEHSEVVRARDAGIAALQSSISAKDLELERLIQSLSSKDIELQRLNNGKLVLEQKLDDLLKQKEKELAGLMKKVKEMSEEHANKMDELERRYRKEISDSQEQVGLKDRIIEKLAAGNSEKDRIIEDFAEALKDTSSIDNSIPEETQDIRDSLLKKLQNQLKQKENAVQSVMDEKYRSLEEKNVELQELRQALRERDRLIEKINAAVMSAEQQIQLFQKACDEKDDIIYKLKTSNQEQNKAHKESLDALTASKHNNEAMFQKLKITLETKEKELVALKDFVKDITRSSTQNQTEEGIRFQDMTEELKEKEKLIENLLQERSRVTSVNEANSQRLMTALQEKDKLLKDASDSLIRIQNEKNSTIQHLQELLNSKDLELQSLENNKAWLNQEQELLVKKLRSGIKDKDTIIEELVESNKEKDQLLMKLQDALKTPKKNSEIAALKQTIQELESALKSKKDAVKKLEAERKKLSQAEQENVENKIKIENLEHDLKAKEAAVRQSLQTIENLRSKLKTMPIIEDLKQKFAEQNQALSAAQKDKEQAQMELALLKKSMVEYDGELKSKHDNIELLTHSAQIKDNMIKEMQESHKKQIQDMQENVGYYQRKSYDLETSNDALRQQLAECSELNNSLQRQMEIAQNKANAQSPFRKDAEELNQLREEVILMREQLSTKQRGTTQGGPGTDDDKNEGVPHLQKVLQEQVAETKKLNDILIKEREMYINAVQRFRASPSDPSRSTSPISREFQILKSLRTQLEDGVRQNNILRNQLQDQITAYHLKAASPVPPPPSPYDAVYQREIKELTSRLEESERWNASLQARLNDAAGLDAGDGKMAGSVGTKESIQRLEEQVDNLTKSLQQTTNMNERINKELDQVKKSSRQRITDKDAIINSQNQQITNLQNQLQTTKSTFVELEQRLKDAHEKLEYYARNVNGDYEDLLLEREEEVESLRAALKENQLREELANQKRGSDMGAQTSPMVLRGYVSSEKLKEVEERLRGELTESLERNDYYKNLLDQKVEELQRVQQLAPPTLSINTDSDRDMSTIHTLQQEYEKGILSNEALKRQLESELSSVSSRERSLKADVLTISDLRQKLDESLRCNDSLQVILQENLKAGSGIDGVKKELSAANKKNEALALQIESLHQSIKQFNDIGKEAEKLRNDVKEAHKLNDTLSEQLNEMRNSTGELPLVQRELKQSKMMNEQLGKQLADLLNHMAKMKAQNQKLKSEVDQKSQVIESLELRLSSKPDVHSRGVSPLVPMSTLSVTSPHHDNVYTQTSPGYGLSSPPSVTRFSSPPTSPGRRETSPTSVIEKMHGLNKTLMSENQFLRNKLQQNERYTATLKDELELYNRMKRESLPGLSSPNNTRGTTGQSMDEILAMYMNEMRELRMRLEESIRTNDKLRAQLERRMSESENGGDGIPVLSSDKLLPYIHENEALRAELLAKDKANEELKRTLENMKRTKEIERTQLNVLRQQGEENQQVIINLQNELRVYEQLYKLSSSRAEPNYQGTSYVREGPRSPDGTTDNSAILKLLAEIRSLRLQLEKSITTNNALRLKLEEQLSRPIRESPQASRVSPSDVARRLDFDKDMDRKKTVIPTGNLAAHVDRESFIELQSKIESICIEAYKLKTQIQTNKQPLYLENSIHNLHKWAMDCKDLLQRFVMDDKVVSNRDDGSVSNENMTLRLQISKLKKKLLYQEDAIRRASEQLEESTKRKEGMQTHLIDKLLESQSVLQRARGSLEDYAKTRTDR